MMISQLSPVNNNIKYYSSLASQRSNKQSIENAQTQNNLTYTQSDAIKNTLILNNINFKGKVFAPSFDIKDINTIKKLLSKCQYGKNDLVYGDISHIRLKRTDAGLAIENFYTNDNNLNGKITGICEELTYKLGKRLEKLFGDKYIFFAIDGSNKEFLDAHTHIGVFHNTKANQELVKTQSERFTRAQQLYKEILSMASDNITPEISKKIEEFNNLRLDMSTLKGCLMVDPSFNRIEEFGVGGKTFEGYVSNSIKTIDEVNAIPTNSRVIPHMLGIPLGHLKDLAPEICNAENKNSILSINNLGEIIPTVGSDLNITETLSSSHPIRRFIDRLNKQINE